MGRLKRESAPFLHAKERKEAVSDLMTYSTAFTEGPSGFILAGWIPYMLPAPFCGAALVSFLLFTLQGFESIHLLTLTVSITAALIGFSFIYDISNPKETARAAWYLLGMDDAGLVELKQTFLPKAER